MRPSLRARSASPSVTADAAGAGTWKAKLPAVALALITVLVFARAVNNGFTGWDDTLYIATNPLMRGVEGLGKIWTSVENEQYYPLTFTSHWIEYQIFGAKPAAYLVTNVLLHAINAVLVLALLRGLGVPPLAAWMAALLFAVHPTHAMSVAWIAERKNLLSCAFTVSCLLAWIRFRRTSSERAYIASVVLYLLALLSKTQIVGVVGVLWMLDVCVLRERAASATRRVLPLALLGIGALAVTFVFEQRFVDPTVRDWVPDLAERVQIAALAPFVYVRQALLPLSLSPIYPLWRPSAASLMWWLPFAAILAVLIAGLAFWRRVDPRFLLSAALFLAPLAPTLGIVPFGNFAITHVSDHFLYVPLVGLTIAAGLALSTVLTRAPRAQPAILVLAGIFASFFAWRLQREIPVFKDGHALWSRALERSPDSYAAHLGLAEVLRVRGDGKGATEHYERAIEIRPQWVDAHELLARAELDAGDFARSERSALAALKIAPGNVRALTTLGAVYERTGRIDAALKTYETAVSLDGSSVPARLGLAQMYLGFARYTDAESQFRAMLAGRPGDARARLGVATCLRGRGAHAAAVLWLRESLRENSSDWSSLNMLALLLATSRDDSVRAGGEALALAERAAEGTRFEDPLVLDTLAAAQAEVGRAANAERTSEQAAVVHEAHGDASSAAESRRRAATYARGEVLRR
jgi:tetratricopeptide (TPR) repeat protein